MGTMSTFGSFGIARLGIYASQKAMQVTGNNITNVNTAGYTRQELQLQSLYVGGADRYSSRYDMKIGSGVLCTGVQQIRSPYLDIRYRTEMSKLGSMDTTMGILNELNRIFDEVGDGEEDSGVMEAALQGLIEQLEYYSSEGAGREEFDTIVRGKVKDIVTLFRDYAKDLEDLYADQVNRFRQDVDTVNTILGEIQKLNNSIRKAEIHGGNALELRDERNMMIDELSKYIRIDVLYEPEDIGGGVLVDKLVIKLDSNDAASPNDGAILIDGQFATQLKVPDLSKSDEDLLNTVHQFNITLGTLKDVNGIPKRDVGYYQSGKYNLLKPGDGDTMTIAGYSVKIDPTAVTTIEDQLQAFVDAYNNDPANSGWFASIQEDDNGDPTGCIRFDRRTQADTATVELDPATDLPATGTPDADGKVALTIGGYTAMVLAADNAADQLKAFQEAYNADESNPWTITAADDATGEVTFTLKETEAKKTAVMIPDTKFVADSVNGEEIMYPVVNLTDNDLYGALQATREMLTEKGHFADADDIAVDPNATTKYGIPFYRKIWDAMAIQFANRLNEANTMVGEDGKLILDTDGNYVISPANYYQKDEDGDYIADDGKTKLVLVTDDTAKPKTYSFFEKSQVETELKAALNQTDITLSANGTITDSNGETIGKLAADGTITDLAGQTVGKLDVEGNVNGTQLAKYDLTKIPAREQYTGGVLLSNSGDGDDTAGITAKNISISHSWAENAVHILKSRTDSELDQSSQNSNLLHMVSILRDNKYEYKPGMSDPEWSQNDGTAPDPDNENTWGSAYFTGSFAGMLTKIASTLADDTKSTQTCLGEAITTQNDLSMDRDSVSGVDLNDEAISMMQYNKSYSAACRLMTTLDEMLDKLINGTAI